MREPSFRFMADGNPSPLSKPPGFNGGEAITPPSPYRNLNPPPSTTGNRNTNTNTNTNRSSPATPPLVRKPVFPPNWTPPKHRKSKRSCCRCFCCYFCSFFFLLILLLGIFGCGFYFYFNPTHPVFRVTSVHFSNFTIHEDEGGDGAFLNAHSLVKVEVKNPNEKLGIDYSDVDVKFTVGDELDEEIPLGHDKIPGFVQGKKNTTMLKVETKAKNARVNDGQLLMKDYKSKQMLINVNVQTSVGIVFPIWDLKVGKMPVEVHCSGIKLKSLESHGGGSNPYCSIRILNMIKIS